MGTETKEDRGSRLDPRRGSVRLALLVPVLIALVCTYGINRVRGWSEERRIGEVELARVDSLATRQSFEISKVTSLALSVGEEKNSALRLAVTPLKDRIDALGAESMQALDGLQGSPFNDDVVMEVKQVFSVLQNRFGMVVELIEDGEYEAAWIYNRERVEPTFQSLRSQLAVTQKHLESVAKGAGLVADIATLMIVLGGSAVILMLRLRVDRQRRSFQEQLAHLAYHDSLTDLANRTMLEERLGQALSRVRRNGAPMGLLFVDLDNFKTINDSLGHHGGDAYLVTVAHRLLACTRASDTVARLGGDEFAIILEDMDASDRAEKVARRIIDALTEPVVIHGRTVRASCSIGLSVSPSGSESVEALLGNADVAMYSAKHSGKNTFAVFNRGMRLSQIDRTSRQADLQRGMDGDEMVLHFQPIIDLAEEQIVGVEALVRWQHPSLGLVPPADFIPLAEETGQILQLGRWVLDRSCEQVLEWNEASDRELTLSVNLSAAQFAQPDLVHEVESALTSSGLPASCLMLEITETTLMQDSAATIEKLTALKTIGVKLAIDDFGVGYSSLNYLRRFPVDQLKIDRSFVQSLGDGPEDRALCEAIVKLGPSLGLQTVAEGIEEATQLEWFRSKSCRLGQGFFFQRPAAAEEIGELLARPADRFGFEELVPGA